MFFCINLVFATSNTDDTREVVEEEVADIVIDLSDNEYVLTNVVIDPLTKSNVYTYIVKENVPISFNLINENINPKQATLQKYYYRTIKNKNVRIRCLDTIYADRNVINILPDASFDRLKIANKLNACLFILQFDYKVNAEDTTVDKVAKYFFKIVSDKEFQMYKSIEEFNLIKDQIETIVRPRKIPRN